MSRWMSYQSIHPCCLSAAVQADVLPIDTSVLSVCRCAGGCLTNRYIRAACLPLSRWMPYQSIHPCYLSADVQADVLPIDTSVLPVCRCPGGCLTNRYIRATCLPMSRRMSYQSIHPCCLSAAVQADVLPIDTSVLSAAVQAIVLPIDTSVLSAAVQADVLPIDTSVLPVCRCPGGCLSNRYIRAACLSL